MVVAYFIFWENWKNNEVIEIYKFRSMTDKKKNEIDSRDKNEKIDSLNLENF